ncbi:hypothetical protein BJ170DRAFT_597325 [Xylariales sp. AK1849]|nr:hypothetical protein BJ170DRAFT_597325 [Xylariales sp. AK1849]
MKDDHTPLLTATLKGSQPQVTSTTTPAPEPTPMPPTATPVDTAPRKADTNISWGTPLGLGVRGPNDENLIIFRKALGINWHKENVDNATLEEGRRTATGVYKSVISAQTKKNTQHAALTALLYVLYFAQVVIGAALTALGPAAGEHTVAITLLGAVNTVVAGVLALIKGSGQPQRLGKDQVGYRKLQDWIEETEALLAVGVIGKDRKQVGLLVEVAFKKYNAAIASEENNRPDMYVSQPMESLGNRASSDSPDVGSRPGSTGKTT